MVFLSKVNRNEKYEIISKAFPLVVNETNDEGWCILHRACEDGDIDFVRHILKNDFVEVDVHDKWQNTPLHKAVERGSIEVVKILLDKKASVNSQNLFHRSSIHVAAKINRVEILQILMSLPEVVVNTIDKMSNSPWQTCREENHPMARLFLENHQDLRADADVLAFQRDQVIISIFLLIVIDLTSSAHFYINLWLYRIMVETKFYLLIYVLKYPFSKIGMPQASIISI